MVSHVKTWISQKKKRGISHTATLSQYSFSHWETSHELFSMIGYLAPHSRKTSAKCIWKLIAICSDLVSKLISHNRTWKWSLRECNFFSLRVHDTKGKKFKLWCYNKKHYTSYKFASNILTLDKSMLL